MITEEDEDGNGGTVSTRRAKRKREQQEDEADYLNLEDSNDGAAAPAAKRARTETPAPVAAYNNNNNVNNNNGGANGEKKEKSKKLNRSLRPIWKAVKKAKDETGRSRSKIFMDLPSRELYPDYYQVRRSTQKYLIALILAYINIIFDSTLLSLFAWKTSKRSITRMRNSSTKISCSCLETLSSTICQAR